jgi:hypothetical protein
VAIQHLLRKATDTGTWELIARLPVKDSVYTDRKTEPQHHYEYAIETIDSSGLNSGRSFGLRVFTYGKAYVGTIKNFQASYLQGKQRISLQWTAPGAGISYYILFREKENTGLRMAANIDGNLQQYEEQALHGNYRYAIKAIYANGKESALSEIKQVQIP